MDWEKKADIMYNLTIRELCSKYDINPRFNSSKKKTKSNIVNEIIKQKKITLLPKEKAIAIELISNLYNHPSVILAFIKDNIRLITAKRSAIISLNALKLDLTMFDEIMKELTKVTIQDIVDHNVNY